MSSTRICQFFGLDPNLAGGLIHHPNSLRQINKTATHFAVKYTTY